MKTITLLLLFSIISITAQEVEKPTNIFLQLRARETNQSNLIPLQEALSETDNPDTELILAASKGNLSKIKHCLFLCANIHATNVERQTALHNAVHRGHTECANLLLNRGANIHATDVDGLTPVHRAVIQRHIKCTTLLVNRGADIHATDGKGITPLCSASRLRYPEFVSLLTALSLRSRSSQSIDAIE